MNTKSSANENTHLGAVETETRHDPASHTSLNGQLEHRSNSNSMDEMVKDSDSDFPEPGSSPEHSGQHK